MAALQMEEKILRLLFRHEAAEISISAKYNLSSNKRAYCKYFATVTKKSALDIFLTNHLF